MPDKQRKGLKILVIGEACSGKSTVAHLISEMLEEYGITSDLVDDTDGMPVTLEHRRSQTGRNLRESRIYDALRDRKITIEQLQVSRKPMVWYESKDGTMEPYPLEGHDGI